MSILSLTESYAALGDDERAVLELVGKRLVAGRSQYQELDIAGDGRDWLVEYLYEALDASVYSAAAAIRVLRRLGKWPT